MRVAFYTLGCKVNQYETEILTQQFSADGFDIVKIKEDADIYVINSCTVTSSSDKKTRQIINRLRKQNPTAIIVLTGCFPQAFPENASLFKDIDVITGSYNRKDVIRCVKENLITGKQVINITEHSKKEKFEPMQITKFQERTRAFVKIEDGCDRYCSYCIIPKARGPVRSKSIDELRIEIEHLANEGYKEIVLVGINLSSYGRDIGIRLIDAIETVAEVNGIKRIRLGSLEPELLTQDDINRMAKIDKFCPQFHLSLQSGCDDTLKRMNRHYDTKEYLEIVKMIRDTFSNPSITTDIMVGFPGETHDEFISSLEFAKKVKFSKAHVFAYSRRKGTIADRMDYQINKIEKEKRSHAMIRTTDITRKEFFIKQVGKREQVLFETIKIDNKYEGYTKNYTPVIVDSKEDIRGSIKEVLITEVLDDYCVGKLC